MFLINPVKLADTIIIMFGGQNSFANDKFSCLNDTICTLYTCIYITLYDGDEWKSSQLATRTSAQLSAAYVPTSYMDIKY